MSTFKFAAVAIVAMLFALVPTSAAFAAYEDPAIDVDVHPTTLIGGGSFSGTAESNGVICDWTVTFRGETKTGVGTEISFTFDTPVVDEETERDLKVVCVYNDDNTTQLSGRRGLPPRRLPRTAPRRRCRPCSRGCRAPSRSPCFPSPMMMTTMMTMATATAGGSGALPDTGGSSGMILMSGAALVAAGSGVLYTVRRRRSAFN